MFAENDVLFVHQDTFTDFGYFGLVDRNEQAIYDGEILKRSLDFSDVIYIRTSVD